MNQHPTTRMRLIEVLRGRPIEEIVEELPEKYSLVEDIGADLGLQDRTAYKWLVQFGLERRWVKPEPTTEREGTGA